MNVELRKPRVLLADDTHDNQLVVSRILERHGYDVTVASDGQQAVALWQQHPFDVVLMDVQMPELDGYDATALIRDQEKASGADPTPVVALTGHVSDDDRQRCLDAGMTTHLSKPIDPRLLLKVVGELVSGEQATENTSAGTPTGFQLDGPSLVARMEGDLDLVKKLIGFFERDAPELMNQIAAAIEAEDGEKLAFAAHRFSGLVRNFAADRAATDTLLLEEMGRAANFRAARTVFSRLALGIRQLSEQLRTFREQLEKRTE